MRGAFTLFLMLVLADLGASEPLAKAPPTSPAPQEGLIGIGQGEGDASHLGFETPQGARITKIRTRLIVDKAPPRGLNFFAIQVDFPNQTWAHGGPQVNEDDGRVATYANWGGLVDRGGGSDDYVKADPAKDFYLIECGIGKPNTVPWKWKMGREYVLTVERGRLVDLPAGGGHGEDRDITLGKRRMWEWRFTIAPADGGKDVESFGSLLYDTADHVGSFCVWNESGYGSFGHEQHARWSVPTYWVEGDPAEKSPSKWWRD